MKDILQSTTFPLHILLFSVCLGSFSSITCFGFFKSAPEETPARIGYLSFQSPPKLRFHALEPLADRKNLMTLTKKNLDLSTEKSSGIAVKEEDVFPIISYDSDQNTTSPVYNIPSGQLNQPLMQETLLPPNDPFVEQDMPEPNLNNTDELMEILESSLGSSSRKIGTQVNFVPPYTLDGGNMVLESKTKYTRRVR